MTKENIVDLIITCPHCKEYIVISKNEINCRIFRHGVYKSTNKPINPHSSKEKCDALYSQKKIYGCGKPFKLDENNKPEICDYI